MKTKALRVYVSRCKLRALSIEASTDRSQFACLVPTCDRLCSTAPKRRMHCVDKHQFPKNYDFFIINDGIDRRSSMLRPTHRRRSSAMDTSAANASRRRGESFASAAGDSMDVGPNEGEVKAAIQQQRELKSSHMKLRGRGGFSHPQGYGRGRGSQERAVLDSRQKEADTVDSLANSMSALHFVPHSVRMARGKGRGRGG
jgi:hypothetical protein